MKAIIKEIALWICAVAGGLAFLFGMFCEVDIEQTGIWFFLAVKTGAVIGMLMLILASNSTMLGKRLTADDK